MPSRRKKQKVVLLHADRKRQALDLIARRPGVQTQEISQELGIPLTSVFHILTDLWHAGLIEHYVDGWRVVSLVMT